MQSNSKPSEPTEYISRDDEAEAERIPQDTQGYGEILTEEDVKAYSLHDFNSFDQGIRGRG